MNQNNNYELADSILQLFDNDALLPRRTNNSCLNCSNAVWYKNQDETISATCLKQNATVYRKSRANELGAKQNEIFGVKVCSGNPTFRPEK